MRTYYVYILASVSRVLYVGVTSNLRLRIGQHKQKKLPGFTARYNVTRLVYVEESKDVAAAIAREKQLKRWTRARKIALIETANPLWEDLAKELDAG